MGQSLCLKMYTKNIYLHNSVFLCLSVMGITFISNYWIMIFFTDDESGDDESLVEDEEDEGKYWIISFD